MVDEQYNIEVIKQNTNNIIHFIHVYILTSLIGCFPAGKTPNPIASAPARSDVGGGTPGPIVGGAPSPIVGCTRFPALFLASQL